MATTHIPIHGTDSSDAPMRDSTAAPPALKLLYAYTIVGAGLVGLWLVVAPSSFVRAFGMPSQDPFNLGVVGCVYAAFALVAALGLRAPIVFAPMFLVQLVYKSLWLALVFVPYLARGSAPAYAWVLAAVFASYVVLDVIAIPFSRLLGERRA